MTEIATASAPQPGLLARYFGVLVSPRDTFAAVAARPRAFGALAITVLIVAGAQGAFLATPVGKEATLKQQEKVLDAFGVNIPDEAYQRMQDQMWMAPYTNAGSQMVVWPLLTTIFAGLFMGVFSMLMGGNATFKHVFSIVAHSSAVIAASQLFSMPLSYARGEFVGATLGVFVPMFEETSFIARFLGAIDLFFIGWMLNVAIGLAVLYRRRSGGIATTLIGIYVAIALVIAFVRSGS